MPIDKLKNIEPSDLDKTVWRYLTFPKFISLLAYGTVWFSKLNILTDQYEGHMPTETDAEMRAEWDRMKFTFPEELHEQFDTMNKINVEDGRELTVASCLFLNDSESEKMWKGYVGTTEGVAIKSTIRLLSQNVFCDPRYSQIGRVKYVDLNTYTMSHYEANQAQERAFFKRLEFEHESEVRIVTMNLRGPMCLSMEGEPLKPAELQGAGMNNFGNDGLYIRADLQSLVSEIVLAPGASKWFELLIKKIARNSQAGWKVDRSKLDK